MRDLDLSGQIGKEIVRSKTKLVMQVHKKTFAKLADAVRDLVIEALTETDFADILYAQYAKDLGE